MHELQVPKDAVKALTLARSGLQGRVDRGQGIKINVSSRPSGLFPSLRRSDASTRVNFDDTVLVAEAIKALLRRLENG